MKIILEPLKRAGKDGVMMESSDGSVCRVHPILTSYVADYPEQCLVTCSKYSTCPKCQTSAEELGQLKNPPDPLQSASWTLGIIKDGLEAHGCGNHGGFHKHFMENGVTGGVYSPFWKDFPFTDIHQITTPDVLHQLYQGVLKHLIIWAQQTVGKDELDARIQTFSQMAGIRHFKNGISALSQISGSERKNMAKIILCAVADVMPSKGVKAVEAFLDFLYLAQYTTHDNDTLTYLRAAPEEFHKHTDFFVQLGCRDHLNLPKLHSLIHYVECIEFFGTTNSYNTEMFERLHINFAKYGWRATNQRDKFPQMITWLSRQEKINDLERNIKRCLKSTLGSNPSRSTVAPAFPSPSISENRAVITLSRRPCYPSRAIDHITVLHNAPHFTRHLAQYLKTFIAPPGIRTNNLTLPFRTLNVWTVFWITPPPLHDNPADQEIVHAEPCVGSLSSGRYNVVLVKEDEDADIFGVEGIRVGRVKVIFTLPHTLAFPGSLQNAPEQWPREPLAYVEWFTRFGPRPDQVTGMYKVSPALDSQKKRMGGIIPLSKIRQSCMLCPIFGQKKESVWKENGWTSKAVLEQAGSFYLNNWHIIRQYTDHIH